MSRNPDFLVRYEFGIVRKSRTSDSRYFFLGLLRICVHPPPKNLSFFSESAFIRVHLRLKILSSLTGLSMRHGSAGRYADRYGKPCMNRDRSSRLNRAGGSPKQASGCAVSMYGRQRNLSLRGRRGSFSDRREKPIHACFRNCGHDREDAELDHGTSCSFFWLSPRYGMPNSRPLRNPASCHRAFPSR